MEKLNLSNHVYLEHKINELIDEVHDLQDIIVEQNTIIARQLEKIAKHKAKEEEILNEQNLRFQKQTNYIEQMDNKFNAMKKELSDALTQAVKEQSIDSFQNWLQKK